MNSAVRAVYQGPGSAMQASTLVLYDNNLSLEMYHKEVKLSDLRRLTSGHMVTGYGTLVRVLCDALIDNIKNTIA